VSFGNQENEMMKCSHMVDLGLYGCSASISPSIAAAEDP
jgi:hypothetical protein